MMSVIQFHQFLQFFQQRAINMKEQAQRQTRFQSKAESCGICYNAIENQGVLDSCNHSFCSDCIKKWSNIENTCPLCKQKFTQIESKWKRVYFEINSGSLQKPQDIKAKMQIKQDLCQRQKLVTKGRSVQCFT
ncbi:unnamed protein product (macronuclear) [Paramecium tetraurelia]|uniref:RING-type domain-containing protein n=1 Tax=Paramecium tetraurelia TaxID=5888 RepID=A0BEH9_PARTE|nr:uncharacterized protein GSPATT00027979001 [Paramecium tetraurelia]CAK56946.1 unnamed protein product [Paramecium tetraurelia]|eukprot:XP_001424344.1 hypothetical protein (macronuclear) [Paramecium tetraurelia strain d4-2]